MYYKDSVFLPQELLIFVNIVENNYNKENSDSLFYLDYL